jgi:hypothetical protein
MTSKLRAMLFEASEVAEVIFKRDGCIEPCWTFTTRAGNTAMLPPPPCDKDASIAIIRDVFNMLDVVGYVFMDEAWSLVSSMAEDRRFVDIAAHPDRVEIIILMAELEWEGMLLGQRRVIRPKRGRPRLDPLVLDASPIIKGRMTGLLPQRGTRH